MEYYNEGNEKYNQNDFDKAFNIYTEGLKEPDIDYKLKIKLLSNRSICSLKLRLFNEIIIDCTAVLLVEPDNIKAILRRAMAYEYCGDFKNALCDIISAKKSKHCGIHSSNLNSSENRLRNLISRDEIITKREGVPEKLISSGQTLRIMITDHPGRNIELKKLYCIKVCLGNEFGLWNKSLLYENSDIKNDMIKAKINSSIKIISNSSQFLEIQENIKFNSESVEISEHGKVIEKKKRNLHTLLIIFILPFNFIFDLYFLKYIFSQSIFFSYYIRQKYFSA